MPARPIDSAKPAIYLDTSTLSHAFDAHAFAAPTIPTPFKQLLPWIERVSKEANLIFSHFHLSELVAWDKAEPLISWLDQLQLVWSYFPNRVQLMEDDFWVGVATGQSPPPLVPFAPSMLRTFTKPPLEILETKTLLEAFRQERRSHRLAALIKDEAASAARHFHADRHAQGWPKISPPQRAKFERQVQARHDADLRARGQEPRTSACAKRHGTAPSSISLSWKTLS